MALLWLTFVTLPTLVLPDFYCCLLLLLLQASNALMLDGLMY